MRSTPVALNGGKHLLDDLAMEDLARVEGQHDARAAAEVDAVTALASYQGKAGGE